MAPLVAALVLLAAPVSPDARISASSAAAQALQGSLDGTWRLEDVKGRTLYVFQIVDPVGGGVLQAAWREGKSPRAGFIDQIRRSDGALRMEFNDHAAIVRVLLRRRHGIWTGELSGKHARLAVALRRS
ncbi:MAG TPA: hypothetical protein VGH15_12855 [Caulobacteraceae bacterium]|jgi:hypothetical protein